MQDIAEYFWSLPLENMMEISQANSRQTFKLLLFIFSFKLHHFGHFFITLNLIEFFPFMSIVLKGEDSKMIAGILYTTYVDSFLCRLLKDNI